MLEIKYKSIEDLLPYARNSRTHSDAQVAQIASSIREFGFTNPVLIDEHGSIIAGHGRVMAARKLKLTEVPTITLSHLSETQRRAYVIADNKLALNAGWDDEMLRIEIEDLKSLDFDISMLGFDDNEISSLFGNEISEGLVDDDDIPNVEEESVTKNGDIWILGSHRLMCGDSTNIDNVSMLTKNNKIDLVFTDPMYNDETKGFLNVIECIDVKNIVLMTTFKQAISVLNNTGWDFKFDCILYFKTPSSMMNKKVPYYHHKNVFYLTKSSNDDSIFSCDNAKGAFSENGYYPSVIEAKKNTNEEHGLSKPIDSIVKLLSGYKAKSVIDLFAGSGSTLIACEKTNRINYSIELDEKYCDVIVKRWQEFTGKKAKLEATGQSFDDLAVDLIQGVK